MNNLVRLSAADRKSVNKRLSSLPSYHESIPLSTISDLLEERNLILIQEDNTEYSGIFCGEEGSAYISLAFKSSAKVKDNITFYDCIFNSVLVITWYKMQSGKYEIVSYLS